MCDRAKVRIALREVVFSLSLTLFFMTFSTMSSMRREEEKTRHRWLSSRRFSSRSMRKTSLPDSSINRSSEMWLMLNCDGSWATAASSESTSTLETKQRKGRLLLLLCCWCWTAIGLEPRAHPANPRQCWKSNNYWVTTTTNVEQWWVLSHSCIQWIHVHTVPPTNAQGYYYYYCESTSTLHHQLTWAHYYYLVTTTTTNDVE